VSLPRHFVGDSTTDTVLRRAEPGEHSTNTELYSPFFTPQSSLIEWGIGVDLYFSTLRMMSGILLFAALINIPTILFYASTDYSPNGKDQLTFSLQGSAICTTYVWVVCQLNQCPADLFLTERRLATRGVAEDGTVLVLRNGCDGGQLPQGMTNWTTLLLLILLVSLASIYLRAREVRFNEDK
jgi:hypothetical protein